MHHLSFFFLQLVVFGFMLSQINSFVGRHKWGATSHSTFMRLNLSNHHRNHKLSGTVLSNVVHKKAAFNVSWEEKMFFESLKLFVQESTVPITVRVAGGWVRDKILRLPSKNDIDITIDTMSGLEFVSSYNTWRKNRGEEQQRYNVVKKNPDKSKHLETVTVREGNLHVDFVNLRTESYCDHSRIPQIALGTPTEDALRRDLTINSLFYNIQTEEIEDYTGHGLKDLNDRIVRTPLPPKVTLTDDPLRALRAIRFACRFDFYLDEELLHACGDRNMQEILDLKVSRSRIFTELVGMMDTHAFYRACYLLHHTNLLSVILPLPPASIPSYSYSTNSHEGKLFYDIATFSVLIQRYIASLATNSDINNHLSIANVANNVESDQELVKYTSFANLVMAASSELTKSFPSNHAIHRSSLRMVSPFLTFLQKKLDLSNKIIKDIYHIHLCLEDFKKLLLVKKNDGLFLSVCENNSLPFEEERKFHKLVTSRRSIEYDTKTRTINRLELGLAVSAAGVHYKEIFLVAVVSSIIDTVLQHFSKSGEKSTISNEEMNQLLIILANHLQIADVQRLQSAEPNPHIVKKFESLQMPIQQIFHRADYILQLIQEWKIDLVRETPALLDGEQLKKINPKCVENAKIIKDMMSIRDRWHLLNPMGTANDLREFFNLILNPIE